VILYMVLMMDFPRFESCDKKGFLLVKVIPSIWSKELFELRCSAISLYNCISI
jgi:hypothetical protein